MKEEIKNSIELFEQLASQIIPVGETNRDTTILSNIEFQGDLIKELLIDFMEAERYSERVEYSMKEIGRKAKYFLNEFKEIINIHEPKL